MTNTDKDTESYGKQKKKKETNIHKNKQLVPKKKTKKSAEKKLHKKR